VLLFVLVILAVLSAAIVHFTEKATAEIAAEGYYVARARLRIVAYSALETTLGVLADHIAIDGKLTSPTQGWGEPLVVADFEPPEGVKVGVEFIDESGRLPLRSLDELTLVPLFSAMGFENDEVLHLTNSLLDWADEDDDERIDGAESDIYAEAEWPHMASNRPVRRLSELAVVDGFNSLFFDEDGQPNGYYRSFAGAVSELGTGSLNINSASDLALRAVGGLGDLQIKALRDYMAGADRVPRTADDREIEDVGTLAGIIGVVPEGVEFGTQITTLRIRIIVDEGGSVFALEAVVQPGRGASGSLSRGAAGGGEPGVAPAGAPVDPDAIGGGAQVAYPFVFLEMTEDVSHNSTIAAPLDVASESRRR